jgi:hypothetical protein
MLTRGNKILIFMVTAAVIALGFGFYVMNQRIQNPVVSQTDSNPTQNDETEEITPTPEPQPDLVATTNWKIYENAKHNFSLKYPTNLKAGSISDNSVLGTYDAPVRGFHVGPLVFVVLKDAALKKDAQSLFDGLYTAAQNPKPAQGAELPPVECKIDTVTNTKVTSIKSVSCNGEGGPAKYAYIAGPTYDVFVDGYSKGYDNSDNGNFTSASDYVTLLSTFAFSTDAQAITNTSTQTTLTSTGTTPNTPTIQAFTISADDNSANPNQITVTKNAIVEITFNVGSDVYYGGLDFRSSVVNSGTISANSSKTISFKADQSFAFTPYWPASNVSKPYKINVIVQ